MSTTNISMRIQKCFMYAMFPQTLEDGKQLSKGRVYLIWNVFYRPLTGAGLQKLGLLHLTLTHFSLFFKYSHHSFYNSWSDILSSFHSWVNSWSQCLNSEQLLSIYFKTIQEHFNRSNIYMFVCLFILDNIGKLTRSSLTHKRLSILS